MIVFMCIGYLSVCGGVMVCDVVLVSLVVLNLFGLNM